MWNWGQSPFPHTKVSDKTKLLHVKKGTDPNSTFFYLHLLLLINHIVILMLIIGAGAVYRVT